MNRVGHSDLDGAGPLERDYQRGLDRGARTARDDTALVAADGPRSRDALRALTIAKLHALLDAGVPGSRVALFGAPTADMIATYLACIIGGYVAIPVDPAFPDAWRQSLLAETSPDVIVSDDPDLPGIECPGDAAIPMHGPSATSDEAWPELPDIDRHADAIILRTSGSTGTPKTVFVSRANLRASFATAATIYGLGRDDSMLATASISFSSSLRQVLFPIWAGARPVVCSKDILGDVPGLLDLMDTHRVTVADLIPNLLDAVGRSCAGAPELGSFLQRLPLRIVTTASEPLRIDTYRVFRDLLPDCPFVNMYGLTETTGIVAANRLDGPVVDEPGLIVPIGKPVGQNRLELDTGLPGPGRLSVSSAQVARCMPPQPERDRCVTGDIAAFDDADQNWRLLGREDDQVKINGVRLSAASVSSALQGHPAILDAAAFVADGETQVRLHAAYVAETDIPVAELRRHIADTLHAAAIPQKIFRIKGIPRLPNRKIDKQALIAQSAQTAGKRNGAQPRGAEVCSGTLQALREIWMHRLDLNTLEDDAHFFSSGGDSLRSLQIIADIKRRFGVFLPLDHFHQDDSLIGLAEWLQSAPKGPNGGAR